MIVFDGFIHESKITINGRIGMNIEAVMLVRNAQWGE